MIDFPEIRYRLTSPWRYFRIQDDTSFLAWIDWYLPVSIAFLSIIGMVTKSYYFVPKAHDLVTNTFENILAVCSLSNIIYILPGFFIAALSAIATFDKPSLDEYMPGTNPPRVNLKMSGIENINEYTLTRRRFLCMMFSFLSAQSLILAIIIFITKNFIIDLGIKLKPIFCSMCTWGLSFSLEFFFQLLAFFILFIFFQIVFITLHGLYYLGERLLNTN